MEGNILLSNHADVPYGPQFTIEVVLHRFSLPDDLVSFGPNLPWLTLFAAGETSESTVWEKPVLMTGSADRPLVRLGLAKKSRYVTAEIVDLGQASPVRMVSTAALLDADCVQVALSVDVDNHLARLYADSRLVTDPVSITSSAKIARLESAYCGSGTTVPAVYFRVWRRCLTADELASVKCREVSCDWDDQFRHPNLQLAISVSRKGDIAWNCVVESESSKLVTVIDQLADRVLSSDHAPEAASTDRLAKRQAAATTLSQVTSGLRELLAKNETREPEMLAFFRDNPAAAFLLAPMLKRQWREVLLQDFGQIDFVAETVPGRFLAVEIESPTQGLFKKSAEISAAVYHAIDQVEKWTRGVAKSTHHASKVFGCTDLELFDRLVVIGRSADLTGDDRRSRWSDWSRKGTELRTWDDVVAVGEQLVERLSDPSVTGYSWES